MSAPSPSPFRRLLDLTFRQVQDSLVNELFAVMSEGWIDQTRAFTQEHGIPLRALRYRQSPMPVIAEVAMIKNHCFIFRQLLTSDASAHRAMVYCVFSRFRNVIDLVAIVPALNQAAFVLGTNGVLGLHQTTDLAAQEGVRVYLDPMEYFRRGRQGILIVNPAKAALELRGILLEVSSSEEMAGLTQLGLGHLQTIIRRPRRRCG